MSGRKLPSRSPEEPGSLDDNPGPLVRHSLGFWLTVLGGVLLVVWILDQTSPLPWAFPRTWYVHRTAWGMIGLVLAFGGLWLQRGESPEMSSRNWQPARPGRRFARMILYTREGCHLCEAAAEQLAAHADHLPELETVDIEGDPALRELYGLTIPVVEFDGQARFWGKIDEALLRRLIENTPPLKSRHGDAAGI